MSQLIFNKKRIFITFIDLKTLVNNAENGVDKKSTK